MSALSTDQLLRLGQQNLAKQDQIVSSVNAVNRMRSGLPGVGAPGSNSDTDQTNLNLAASMDHADTGNRFGFDSPEYQQGSQQPTPAVDAIDIGAVNSRRNAILAGKDPDNPALYVSDTPNRHGVSRRQQLFSELPVLTQVVRDHAFEQAKNAHESFLHQKDIDSANDVAGFFDALGKTKTKIGSPDHPQEVAGLISQFPHAAGSAAVREALKTHTALHAEIAPLTPPEGMQLDHIVQGSDGKSHAVFKPIPEVTTYESKSALLDENPNARPKQNARGGWYDSGETTVRQVKPATDPIEEDLQKGFGLTKQQFLHPVKVEAGTTDGDGVFTASANGNVYRIDTGKAKNPTVLMPKELVDHYTSAFTPKEAAVTPAAPADLKALAEKALADPDASEVHKAAARKLLGK